MTSGSGASSVLTKVRERVGALTARPGRRGAALPGLVALVSLALPALAAAPAGAVVRSLPDVFPAAGIELNGNVSAIARSDDRIFLGGQFTRVGEPRPFGGDVAVSDGAPSAAFAKPNANVNAVISDGAGGWYIGGTFTAVGSAVRNRLAHVRADGSVDPAFDPNLNGDVFALVLSGGKLYAGGTFTQANGATARNRVAAFDAATGLVDAAFDPNVADNQVRALALSGGKLYVGGTFTQVGAGTARNGLAAFDATTGGVDAAFDPNVGGIRALAVAGGKVYAGGGFTTVNAGAPGGPVTRRNLAAFDPVTGIVDQQLDPRPNAIVNAVVVSGGKLYAGGQFRFVNCPSLPTTCNQFSTAARRNKLAAFDATTGVVDPDFDPDLAGSSTSGDAQQFVSALVLSGGKLYAGWSFPTAVNFGAANRNFAAAFDPGTGAVDPGFVPNPSDAVTAIAVAGSRAYLGGAFQFLGDAAVHERLVALRFDGTVDESFDPPTFSGGNDVGALLLSGGRLYAGGDFTAVGGIARNRIAAFDPGTGALDPAFDPNTDGNVRALLASGGKLYLSGSFATVGGVSRPALAAVDPLTGAVDTAFIPGAPFTVGSVALFVAAADKLYVSGQFAGRLVAIDATTGAPDATFMPNITGSGVGALRLVGSKLYIAGTFTAVGGVPRNGLAAVDLATGALDATFDPNAGQGIGQLQLSGNTLYLGGTFQTIAGTPRSRLAAVDATTGALDAAFNPNMSSSVTTLLASGSQLYAGGLFTTVGGIARPRVARFSEAPPSPPVVVTGAASAVSETGASVAGTVNPGGAAAAYVFEYGTSLTFGAISTPGPAGSGSSDAPVSASLTGLSAATTYYYRVVATSPAGTTFGTVRTFRTGPAQAPAAVTAAASAITSTSATLAGQVNPRGQLTAYTFEYGTTTSFGQITPVVALDDADALEPVSATLSGLSPNTTYRYRVVATNASGTTTGPVQSFTTAAAAT